MYLHISCKQVKTENNKKMCVLHSLTLFLSSAYQSLTPSAYAMHVVGGKCGFFCAVIFDWLCKKKKEKRKERRKGTWPLTLTRVTPSLKRWHCVHVNEPRRLHTFITNLQTRLQILSMSIFGYLLVESKILSLSFTYIMSVISFQLLY